MKPVKAILLILLVCAVAAIAGVMIGVYGVVAKPPATPPGTKFTDAHLVYHEAPSPEPATNAIGVHPEPVAGEPPSPGQMPRRLMPLSPAARPMMPPPFAIAPGHQTLPMAPFARRQGLDDLFTAARERMVKEQLVGRGFTDPAVLRVMQAVKRDNFAPGMQLSNAYVDMTMDCGSGRTLETPFVIATTARQLASRPGDRILEVEAAPGYATAVYSMLVKEVYATQSIYADSMAVDLQMRGFTNNVFVREAGAAQGWPEAAPFDAIVFNGPVAQISENLLAQMKPGGRFIIPVTDDGKLCVLTKSGAQLVIQATLPVRPTPIPGNQVPLPPMPAIRIVSPQR